MPDSHEIEHGERFDRIADQYDQTPDQYPIRGQVRDEAIRVVQSLGSQRVLDAGCGTGTVLLELASFITHGIGIDVSKRMLEVADHKRAVAKITNVNFAFGSLMDLSTDFLRQNNLPLQDAILSTYAMHHLPQAAKENLVSRLAPMLTQGGSLVVGDLIFFDSPSKYQEDFPLVGYDPDNDDPENIDALEAMLKRAQLETRFIKVHPLAGVLIGTRHEEQTH
ncbi:class I SAM-dependent methyltransferase [Roseiconus lacunae]|uniref:Class I SAM-dependent methyltransferase n=1 Tax=Roseiconus lacunae TaxID=2605694 RepID=A0ABT7PPX0_9BACT|nr:class I SAM-dependent methyltransferase [Roseiconus lacunae]MDM4018196.1 class I SAM-dependent methyltransferase [Roseiconus lacunae]